MFLKKGIPSLVLAPMEGVTDAPLRDFITRTGYYDYCVSEFIRVSGNVLPSKVFTKHVPELLNGARTPAGVPVQVQILGGDPERMAESAMNAVLAGAKAIDINFGCPAPTVNRHDGGATLLKYPVRVEGIVRAIRDRLPSHIPVSAKMRLGFDSMDAIDENAKRAEQGGANWITIHGRTKTQGYIPPAYWKPIGRAVKGVSIPVVANGEIWNLEDFNRCANETGAIHFMIGRGALAKPNLARDIRRALGLPLANHPDSFQFPENLEAKEWAKIFHHYSMVQSSEKRMKQWIRYLRTKNEFPWWDEIKGLQSVKEILNHLERS